MTGSLIGNAVYRLKIVAVFFTVLLGWIVCSVFTTSLALAQAPRPVVTVTQVQQGVIDQPLDATGRLTALRRMDLRAEVTAKVVTHQLVDGARVEQGQLLVQFDDRRLRTQERQLHIQLDEANSQLARYQRLILTQAITQEMLQQQQARVASLRTELEALQVELARYQLHAPFQGDLGAHQLIAGQLVDAGSVLTHLDQLDVMQVEFTLPERYLPHLNVGQIFNLEVLARPGHSWQGEIDHLSTRIDPRSGQILLRGRLDNPEHLLRPGMSAHVRLHIAPRLGLTVPVQSLVYFGSDVAVFVVDEMQRVQRRQVQLGRVTAHWAEILSGLEAGESLVHHGVVRMREGLVVRVTAVSGE